MSDGLNFTVSNIYGMRKRKPLVRFQESSLRVDVLMTPTEARALALNLLEGAEAADQEGNVIRFLREKLEATDEQIAQIVTDFRGMRQESP